jgi:site-specific recombinase XerD
LTKKAIAVLKQQKLVRQKIFLEHAADASDEYKDLVFVTKNNRPTQQFIVQECIDVTMRRIRKEYPEFERVSPHCFRHTFATRAIENGMQPKSLQKLLGHKSLQITMDLYCHVTEDTLFEAMELMECAM